MKYAKINSLYSKFQESLQIYIARIFLLPFRFKWRSFGNTNAQISQGYFFQCISVYDISIVNFVQKLFHRLYSGMMVFIKCVFVGDDLNLNSEKMLIHIFYKYMVFCQCAYACAYSNVSALQIQNYTHHKNMVFLQYVFSYDTLTVSYVEKKIHMSRK